jgi:hypothetical protein
VSDAAGKEPSLAASLRVRPTSEERLAALEAEREREQAAVRELEVRLTEVKAAGELLNEDRRFRQAFWMTFVLGVLGVVLAFFLMVRGVC